MLAKKNRKQYVNDILFAKNIFCVPSIKKLTLKHARKHNVSDQENIELIKQMTLTALEHDFWGKGNGKVLQDLQERTFDIDISEENKSYRLRGFIDRQFMYEDGSSVVRDYKTSKAVFSGKDADDNLQHFIYTLASKKLDPKYEVAMEFLFLKFDLQKKKGGGLLKMEPLSEKDLSDFELHLTEVQKVIDNFSERDAYSNFAADKPMPSDGSFSGKLSCGFAKYKGQLKKDGNPMWHCPYKFDFIYYALRDKENKIVKTAFGEDAGDLFKGMPEGFKVTKEQYAGCPAHQKT